jgi:hypothetical protein
MTNPRKFRSAEDRIEEEDFESVLSVLCGTSPWRDFVVPALAEARKSLPSRPFRILNRADYETEFRKIDKGDPDGSPGITNKKDGVILMLEFFGVKSRATRLGLALHEAVHLVSHRPGRSGKAHSTAYPVLGEGLLEGLVEVVTSDILRAQQITLASPEGRGHQKRVPVAEELIRTLNIPCLAKVLFAGDYSVFFQVMTATYTGPGWIEIQRLTTADDPAGAIRRMNELRAAEARNNKARLERLMRQVPKPTAGQLAGPDRGFTWHRGMSPPPPMKY